MSTLTDSAEEHRRELPSIRSPWGALSWFVQFFTVGMGSSLIYTGYCMWLVFNVAVRPMDELAAQHLINSHWNWTAVYLALQVLGLWTKTDARHAVDDLTPIKEFFSSSAPFLPLISYLVLVYGASASFNPTQQSIVWHTTLMTAIDAVGLTLLMLRANRRVEERRADR